MRIPVPAAVLLWCGASFSACRILVAWAYAHTRSLLLAQLVRAAALWLVLGLVVLSEQLACPTAAHAQS